MTGHLFMSRTWQAQCVWCSRYKVVELDERRRVIEMTLRNLRWRKTRTDGWVCSVACSKRVHARARRGAR